MAQVAHAESIPARQRGFVKFADRRSVRDIGKRLSLRPVEACNKLRTRGVDRRSSELWIMYAHWWILLSWIVDHGRDYDSNNAIPAGGIAIG
ncbi:hypothetical protein D3C78_1613460 [compost metagenome]